jgi:hypothetical protein
MENDMGKTKKKAYTGSKKVDKSCRSHGSCPYCQGKIKYKREKLMGGREGQYEQEK